MQKNAVEAGGVGGKRSILTACDRRRPPASGSTKQAHMGWRPVNGIQTKAERHPTAISAAAGRGNDRVTPGQRLQQTEDRQADSPSAQGKRVRIATSRAQQLTPPSQHLGASRIAYSSGRREGKGLHNGDRQRKEERRVGWVEQWGRALTVCGGIPPPRLEIRTIVATAHATALHPPQPGKAEVSHRTVAQICPSRTTAVLKWISDSL
jgi:hypothetical protein